MAKTDRAILRQSAREPGVAIDLPQRHGHEHTASLAGHSAEHIPASVLDQGSQAHGALQRHMVPGHADAGDVPDPGHHRHFADALLPPFRAASLRRHEGPAVRRLLRAVPAQSAPLVGARDGFLVFAHMFKVFYRGAYPHTARIQLGRRHRAAADHAAAQLHRLPAALGPAGILGDHGRVQSSLPRCR